MNENDLRVIKTKESIENAFLSLLQKKPAEKISVVELAREARINKGTFYLHYSDIRDLYQKTLRKKMYEAFENTDYFNDFFDNPENFSSMLNKAFTASIPVIGIFGQKKDSNFMLYPTMELLREKLYKTGRIRICPENDMKIDALFSAC